MSTESKLKCSGWLKVKRITLRVTGISETGIHCRIYATYLFGKKEIEKDLSPLTGDFFASVKGTVTIESNENFKMKGKVIVQ